MIGRQLCIQKDTITDDGILYNFATTARADVSMTMMQYKDSTTYPNKGGSTSFKGVERCKCGSKGSIGN